MSQKDRPLDPEFGHAAKSLGLSSPNMDDQGRPIGQGSGPIMRAAAEIAGGSVAASLAARKKSAPQGPESFADFVGRLDISDDHRKEVLAAADHNPNASILVQETLMKNKLHDLRPDLDQAVRNRSGVKPEGV